MWGGSDRRKTGPIYSVEKDISTYGLLLGNVQGNVELNTRTNGNLARYIRLIKACGLDKEHF